MPNWLNWKLIDSTAQRVGGWAGAIAAAFAAAVAIMTWVANSITALAGYGWGVPVLVAIGVVLMIVVALSFAAVPTARAWRTFYPLKAAPDSNTETETAMPTSDGDELAIIRSQIDEVSANAAQARRDIVTTMNNLALDSDKGLKAANTKITGIEANLGKNSTKLHEIGQESPVIFEIIMEMLAHSLLFNGIPAEPELFPVSDLTPDNIEHQRTIASEYWEAVRQALSATQWEYMLRGIDQHAKDAADHFVRQIPANERPAGIDILDLRQYAIIRTRCEQTGIFVRAARLEASPKYRGWLSLMKQLYEARKSRS